MGITSFIYTCESFVMNMVATIEVAYSMNKKISKFNNIAIKCVLAL